MKTTVKKHEIHRTWIGKEKKDHTEEIRKVREQDIHEQGNFEKENVRKNRETAVGNINREIERKEVQEQRSLKDKKNRSVIKKI